MTGFIKIHNGEFYLYLDPEPKRKAKAWPIVFAFLLGMVVDAWIHFHPVADAEALSLHDKQVKQQVIDQANALAKNRSKKEQLKFRNSQYGVSLEYN